jgi:hypothetical protein
MVIRVSLLLPGVIPTDTGNLTTVIRCNEPYHPNTPSTSVISFIWSLKIYIMNNTGKIIAAMVAGAAAGAVMGVLFAPGKGSETRKKIKDKGAEIADEVKDKFRKGREKLNSLKEDIENSVKEKAEEPA